MRKSYLSSNVHHFAARIINGGSLLIVAGGLALAALLAAGLADPPRIGNRSLTIPPATFALAPDQQSVSPPQPLPAGAGWTLMVGGQCTSQSAPVAGWGFDLTWPGGTVLSLIVYGDGYYRMPPFAPDTTRFIHVRRQINELALFVAPDSTATLRINREIAWQGTLSPPHQPLELRLLAHGSSTGNSTCAIDGGLYWYD